MAVLADGEHHEGGISEQRYPLAVNVKVLKKAPQDVEMYEFDDAPLGSRDALLMVHGLKGEFWKDCFRWQKLCTYLTSDPEFNKSYKIYLVRYDSKLSIAELAAQFKRQLLTFSDAIGKRPVTCIALSMGGNIVAKSLLDKEVDSRVQRVITLGTPFHGSPLFTNEWMDYSLFKWHKTPLTRLDTLLPYDIYFGKHRNLLTDLNWDNSDKNIPDVGRYRIWFYPRRQNELTAATSGNRDVFRFNTESGLDKSKFITYGGYLATDVASGNASRFKAALNAPFWFATTVVPEHMGKEHPVMRCTNQHIAHAVPARQVAPGSFAYGLNDGIVPLVSSLFLPNETLAKEQFAAERDVSKLRPLIDVRRARVFRNVDHLTFIDDYHPRGAERLLRDELSGTSDVKPIFTWILDDILNDGENAELAVGPKRK